ncbi:MAG: phosphatidate cytidylyltransferase [Bacteroidales bacterium]|nr:phosphatidate cytidylyltransferase [Bacteroidales bacterium]
MKNLVLRTVTGILFVAAVVASILLYDITKIPFYVLMTVVSVVGTWEFLKMAGVLRRWPQTILTLIVSAILPALPWMLNEFALLGLFLWLFPFLLFFTFLFAMELFKKEEGSPQLQTVALHVIPLLWIAIPVLLMCILFEDTAALLLALFIIIWLDDTLAYCAGSLFGRHKLCERISPKKTWEGFIIAMVLTVAASVSFGYIGYFIDEVCWSPLEWVGFALVVVLFGTLGDLVESMIKRSCGVKDSGNILPGHGGVLDRFDSVLMAVPAGVLYAFLA